MVTTHFFFINVVEKGERTECPNVKHALVETGPKPAHASSIIPIDSSQIEKYFAITASHRVKLQPKQESMSEYQYYEFRAIDRPLTDKQIAALSRYSSRADITATSLSVEYDWGDFKGDPYQWMEKYFDAFVHVANWGTRWFMVRIPAPVLPREVVSDYYADEFLEFDIKGDNLILSFRSEEDGNWIDDEGWMSSLAALRADLMKGDHRCLYLGWLRSIQGTVYEGDIPEDDVEPPVPAGLRTLSEPLECFADFLGIDSDLIAAAAEQSQDETQLAVSSLEILTWVRSVPETEKDSLLARIIEDDISHPEAALRQRVFSEIKAKHPATVSSAPLRTTSQIAARANAIMKDRQRIKREAAERERIRHEQEQAEQRRRHLESLRGKETNLWNQANQLIVTKRPRNYDEAISILQDLRELAEKYGASPAFYQRMQSLYRDHASKPSLLERLQKAKLAVSDDQRAPRLGLLIFPPHSRT